MRDLKEMYSAMLGSPFVNQAALTRLIVGKAFDLEPDEIDGLVLTEEEAAKMAESKGGNDGEPKELINYKDAPPDIQAQMEEAAGYEPSSSHIHSAETTMAENAAKQAAAIGTAAPEGMMPAGLGLAPQAPPPPMPPQGPVGPPNG
jgi:hypothetical protein